MTFIHVLLLMIGGNHEHHHRHRHRHRHRHQESSLVATIRLGRILPIDFVSGSVSIGHCRDPLGSNQEVGKDS